MDAIEVGESLSVAAKFYGIPKTSLSDHIHDKTTSRKQGPTLVLKHEEEQALENYMINMAEYGHFLTTEQLKLKVALLT